MEQIDHKQIPVYAGKTQEGQTFTHFGEYGEMLDRLEGYHRHALLTAAAAVYTRTGSLELVASALCWTSFQAPFGASEEALQEWIEDIPGPDSQFGTLYARTGGSTRGDV